MTWGPVIQQQMNFFFNFYYNEQSSADDISASNSMYSTCVGP